MPQQQGGYLSTDPNAGTYLSNDPSAGKPIAAQPSPRVDPRKAVAKGGQPIPYSADVTPPDPSMLPLMGGVAAGVLTEGLGLIPMLAGQFAGGAAGSAGEDAATGQPISGSKAIGTGAEFAGTAGVLHGLSRAKDAGRALWSRMSGEGRPEIIDRILRLNRGAATPANSAALLRDAREGGVAVPASEARPMEATPRVSSTWDGTKFGRDTTYNAEVGPGFGKAEINPARAAEKADYGPAYEAANAHKDIVERMPSFRDTVKGWGAAGGLVGGMSGAGAKGAAIGTGIGGAVGALSHPYAGMRAGQALYNTPNIITQGAQAVNPAVATETMRQLVALMLSGKQ